MNKQLVKQNLINLGLSEDESELYLFLSENGPKTPLEISRQSGINRTKIYRLIESMQAKKLVEESNTAWGRKLKATSPDNLELLIRSEEDRLKTKKESLPDLLVLLSELPTTQSTKFEVKHYKGAEGLKQMLWNELQSKEVLLFGYEDINKFAGRKYGDLVRGEAALRKIKYKEIGNSPKDNPTDKNYYNGAKGWEEIFEYRQISEEILKVRHHIQVYNDTVSIMNWWDGDLAGVEIINQPLAEMQRQIFWQFWNLAN